MIPKRLIALSSCRIIRHTSGEMWPGAHPKQKAGTIPAFSFALCAAQTGSSQAPPKQAFSTPDKERHTTATKSHRYNVLSHCVLLIVELDNNEKHKIKVAHEHPYRMRLCAILFWLLLF
ncbi:hypothetical protein N1030_17295 [Desulfovibrio mangrovi]|uniref:hypothetical protein n=1 Tax=Desulfovibrio mangrovi TaxID=2976983 RepID=UPI0022467EFF|nr:hypothetical protein [Desulfovibrio mangrovi]UZP67329.1 hypothetical protein N1030_17295 [Desulfovibrio mangrovi]